MFFVKVRNASVGVARARKRERAAAFNHQCGSRLQTSAFVLRRDAFTAGLICCCCCCCCFFVVVLLFFTDSSEKKQVQDPPVVIAGLSSSPLGGVVESRSSSDSQAHRDIIRTNSEVQTGNRKQLVPCSKERRAKNLFLFISVTNG